MKQYDELAFAASEVLRTLINDPEMLFVAEAHDALSAALAERAGFKALWASGLTISTSLGYRDANEASWTEVADAVERMRSRAVVPILVDGDTGFGNFNNVRLFSKRLLARGAAGICIEDKLFPKMNSFVGDNHPLAEIDEFCGRIKASKDATAGGLVLVARIEALIAGHGLQEALRRAHAYADAGADAILIHSRKSEATEILSFTSEWNNRLPVVIVPTKYYATPTEKFRQAGISTVIWANHGLRASLVAMENVYRQIHKEQSLLTIEPGVAGLEKIFEIFDYGELDIAERRYLQATPMAAE